MSRIDETPLGEQRCLVAAQVTVEYFVRGSGPLVVLLPALARTAREFDPLVLRLNAAGFRTVAIHFPGIGRSRRPVSSQPDLYDFAGDILLVLNDLGLPPMERVHLVGRGLGNRVARAFATRHGDRTASVILLAAGGKGRGWPPLDVLWDYLRLQSPLASRQSRRRRWEALLCARRDVLPDYACERPPWVAVRQQAAAARRSDSRTWWQAGSAPLLVVQGERDRVAPPSQAIELQREFPDRVQLELIPDAGHALLYDQPDAVIACICEFLRRQR